MARIIRMRPMRMYCRRSIRRSSSRTRREGAGSTSSATCPSSLWPSASSTWGRMASSSPSLTDYTRKRVHDAYPNLGAFLTSWNQAESKQAIINELREHGVFFESLAEEVGKDFSAFDLVCHVAFDQPALTRRQRADSVRATGYWAKYSSKAQATLQALLDKYADEGFEPDRDARVLRIDPFFRIGTPIEIVGEFGGKVGYDSAVDELEHHLYATAV